MTASRRVGRGRRRRRGGRRGAPPRARRARNGGVARAASVPTTRARRRRRPQSASSEAWRVPASSVVLQRPHQKIRVRREGVAWQLSPTRRSLRSGRAVVIRGDAGGNVGGIMASRRGLEVGCRVERGAPLGGVRRLQPLRQRGDDFSGGDGGARRLVAGDGVEERAEVVAAALVRRRRRRRSLTNLGGRRRARPLQCGEPGHTVAEKPSIPARGTRLGASTRVSVSAVWRGSSERKSAGATAASTPSDATISTAARVLGRLRGLGGAPVLWSATSRAATPVWRAA